MRPLVVTDAGSGQTRRINPFQMIGWYAAEIALPKREGSATERTILGTTIMLPNAVMANVAESVAIIDSMFVQATAVAPATGAPVRAPAAPEEDLTP